MLYPEHYPLHLSCLRRIAKDLALGESEVVCLSVSSSALAGIDSDTNDEI
jgi:hypothetical protein